MSLSLLVALTVDALLAGALAQVLLAAVLSARAKGWLATITCLVPLGALISLWPSTARGDTLQLDYRVWSWPIALTYRLDGLSLVFALLAAGAGVAVLLYSTEHLVGESETTRFYTLMLALIAGMIHLVLSVDLLLIYFSWEAIGLCSYFLVGFHYRSAEAARSARKLLVMTHLAGYGLLAAMLLLSLHAGTTQWTDPRLAHTFGAGLLLLVLVSVAAKSAQFPLHTWVPEAAAAPAPVSALLQAACYVHAGVYLVARLHSLGPWPPVWQNALVWVGALSVIVGALHALAQKDLKRLLACSTVSDVGHMMLGLGLGTPLGLAAALLHCLGHSVFKAQLYLCADVAPADTCGQRCPPRRVPRTALLCLVGAASAAGVPLFSGFASRWLLYTAALEAGRAFAALAAWLGSVLTMISFLKALSTALRGEWRAAAGTREPGRLTLLAVGALAVANVALGVAPHWALRYVVGPALLSMGAASPGLLSGDWPAIAGLLLALAAAGLGALVYGLAWWPRATPLFAGAEPLPAPGKLACRSLRRVQGLLGWANPDRYYLALSRALVRLSGILGRLTAWPEQRLAPALFMLALLAAALAAPFLRGVPLTSEPASAPASSLAGGVAAAAVALLAAASAAFRRDLPWLAGAGLLAVVGLAVRPPLQPLLLQAAALLALVRAWQESTSRSTAWGYLVVALLSGATSLAVEATGSAPTGLLRGLLLAGLALKLGLLPLGLWLPSIAAATPGPIAGLAVAVVHAATLGELVHLRMVQPALFAPAGLWLALGLLSSLGGALLMLAERDLKRFLAFSTIVDAGYLAVALALGGDLGGAAIAAGAHAAAQGLLFAAITVVEGDAPEKGATEGPGLATRFPVAGAAFVVGALAAMGVPVTAGFVGRWRLYLAAAQAGPVLLVALLVASALSLLAYARVLTCTWWGMPEKPRGHARPLQALVIVALGALLFLAGMWPRLIGGW